MFDPQWLSMPSVYVFTLIYHQLLTTSSYHQLLISIVQKKIMQNTILLGGWHFIDKSGEGVIWHLNVMCESHWPCICMGACYFCPHPFFAAKSDCSAALWHTIIITTYRKCKKDSGCQFIHATREQLTEVWLHPHFFVIIPTLYSSIVNHMWIP